MMDKSVENLRNGKVSEPINLDLIKEDQNLMYFNIRMSVPEMEDLWNDLYKKS